LRRNWRSLSSSSSGRRSILAQCTLRQDAFGLAEEFVGLDNFIKLFAEPDYASAFGLTLLFAVATTRSRWGSRCSFAALADGVVKGAGIYKALLTWPTRWAGHRRRSVVVPV